MTDVKAATGPAAPPDIEITGTAQHRAWQERQLPPVEQLAPDLWSIPVPIPHNPLRYVSVYAFAGPAGLTLIDAGWDSDEGWDALQAGLDGIGGAVAQVRGVLVTHAHFDHIGLARRVREVSGAWVALHPADAAVVSRPDFRDAHLAVATQARWLQAQGAPADEAAAVVGTPEQYAAFTTMALADRLLRHGELADVPGWTLRAIHTPGHTPGHLCFLDERTGLLFSGDHVLPRISPNISADRASDPDPLGDYLAALQDIRSLDVREVLPAHEWRFRGLQARVDQLTAHHEARLAELLVAVRTNPGGVPWDLAGLLTWSRPWDQYDGHMRIFAVTETLAHLRQLLTRGLIVASEGPVPTYTAV
jgi:glyoxylase-like metal-dependent hydrolase (beta-lactamase superfamily II)